MTDIRMSLPSLVKAALDVGDFIARQPAGRTQEGELYRQQMFQIHDALKWVSTRDEAALRAVPRKQEAGE